MAAVDQWVRQSFEPKTRRLRVRFFDDDIRDRLDIASSLVVIIPIESSFEDAVKIIRDRVLQELDRYVFVEAAQSLGFKRDEARQAAEHPMLNSEVRYE